jgi:hypothetical protein
MLLKSIGVFDVRLISQRRRPDGEEKKSRKSEEEEEEEGKKSKMGTIEREELWRDLTLDHQVVSIYYNTSTWATPR